MAANNLILNRLFTQNVLQDLINDNDNSTYCAVVQRYITDGEARNNEELISEIYEFMSKSYRNEYFYKNTLLNKLLIEKHSVETTIALTQIPIGKSKADFILINGKAVVYEIKTELDSFDRLETQLRDYFKAFNHVCVVTSESHFDRISSILQNTPVGIYILTKNNTIGTGLKKEPTEDNAQLDHLVIFKEPTESNTQLDHLAIFKVLHKSEHERILEKYFGQLPVTSQVFYYDECFSLFSKIPLEEAYAMSINELKNRNKIVVSSFQNVPYELKSLMYFSNLKKKDFDALN